MQVKGEDKLELIENIRLLYCLNEQGHSKVNGILRNFAQNPEYIKVSFDQSIQELNDDKVQREIKYKEEQEEARRKLAEKSKRLEEQYRNELFILNRHANPHVNIGLLKAIRFKYGEGTMALINLFDWGYIQGIRAERARRKKVQV